jgi:hypothetical protein
MSPTEALKAEVFGSSIVTAEKYKSKTIEVSGVVASVDEYSVSLKVSPTVDFHGSPANACSFYLRLLPGDIAQQIAQCSPGQSIKLRGEYTSDAVDFRWKIIEAGMNPSPIIKASELASRFNANPLATNTSFNGRHIYLVGEIAEIGEAVKIKGSDDLTLTCFTSYLEDQGLKPGDTLQLLARYESSDDQPPQFVECLHVQTPLPMEGVTYAKSLESGN